MKSLVYAFILFIAVFLVLNYQAERGSLEPWDEAWYASIARNVVRGKVLPLMYNNSIYVDHPPLGFWIEAAFIKLFGESEHSARLPSVIFGSASIALVFLIGLKISNTTTGLIAAIILLTSRWFLLRTRTGNLESLLIFLELTAIYFSWDAKHIRSIFLSWFFLSLSLLTKTFVSLSLLPLLLYNTMIFLKTYKTTKQSVVLVIILFGLPVGLWYFYNIYVFGNWFLIRNIYTVAMRDGGTGIISMQTLANTLLLFRSVVHRWYAPFFISYILSLLFFFKNPNTKRVLLYSTFLTIPYLLSSKTKSWHLIPLIPAVSLVITNCISHCIQKCKQYVPFCNGVVLICIIAIGVLSFREYLPDVYGKDNSESDQKKIGDIIKDLPGPVYLDVYKNLEPRMIYYADRSVIILDPLLKNRISNLQRPYTYITEKINNQPDCELILELNDVKTFQCN